MEKPTANELLSNNIDGLKDFINDEDIFLFYKGVIECYAIEFAKMHVDAALKAAEKSMKIGLSHKAKESLLNIYPLENIK